MTAIAEWDEVDEQVHAIIAMRLSSNLRTHLGSASSPRTAKQAWDSLVSSFGQMGISGLIADFHRAAFTKVSGTQNPQVEIQAIHTLWERLRANQIEIPDYIQGMLLLGAIPQKWDHIAAMYTQGTQTMTSVTFASVRQAIMAEYERTQRPSSNIATKISAVKRKGKSPQFSEQKQSNPKRAADHDHDDRPAPKKRGKRGGKKAREHSHIVSSALVPEAVTKRLQETHHHTAPPPRGGLAPDFSRGGIVIGGPSRAPHVAAKSTRPPPQVASFNSQHKMTLETVKPSSPSHYAHGKLEAGPSAKQHLADKELNALRRHREFCETSTPYRDAVASTSKIVEVPPTPPTIEGTQSFKDAFTGEVERTKELRRRQKKSAAKGKGKGKKVFKSKEVVDVSDDDSDSGISFPDLNEERHGHVIRARSPSHIPGEVADTDGLPRYLKRFVDPTGFGMDNDYQSHIYDNFESINGYRRFVSNHSSSALSTDEYQQLLGALSSLESRIDLIRICSSCCKKCEKDKNEHDIDFLADSGASLSFTPYRSNLTEFEVINDDKMKVQTASKENQLRITGKGSVFFTHFVSERGKLVRMNGRLYPVFYIPGLSVRLLSVGSLLNDGELELRGTSNSLEFKSRKTNRIVISCKPHIPGQTIYWLEARLIPPQTLLAKLTVLSVDYDIMHRCFAHPSKDVL